MDPAFRDQLIAALRIIIPWLLTIAVAKGAIPTDQVGDVTKYAIDAIVGIVTVGAVVWSWLSHRQNSQIANVADMANVTKVVTTKQIAKVDLNENQKVVAHAKPRTTTRKGSTRKTPRANK